MWAGLGFAKLGAGVWLRLVPRMLLGRRFPPWEAAARFGGGGGKNTARLLLLLLFVEGGATVRGWLSLSETRRAGYLPVNAFALCLSGPLVFFGSFESCFVDEQSNTRQ